MITGMKPNQIARMGLARTFQTSQLFAGMSILENMMTGLHLRSRPSCSTVLRSKPGACAPRRRSWLRAPAMRSTS